MPARASARSHHILGELIKRKSESTWCTFPDRGGALLMQDLIAGNIKVAFSTLPVALPQAQVGTICIIAVAEKTRLPELPDTPTIEETVPGVVNVGWNGLLAPAGTPALIIDKLNAVTVAALKTPDVMAQDEASGPACHEQHACGIRRPHRPRGRPLGQDHSVDRHSLGLVLRRR